MVQSTHPKKKEVMLLYANQDFTPRPIDGSYCRPNPPPDAAPITIN